MIKVSDIDRKTWYLAQHSYNSKRRVWIPVRIDTVDEEKRRLYYTAFDGRTGFTFCHDGEAKGSNGAVTLKPCTEKHVRTHMKRLEEKMNELHAERNALLNVKV